MWWKIGNLIKYEGNLYIVTDVMKTKLNKLIFIEPLNPGLNKKAIALQLLRKPTNKDYLDFLISKKINYLI